MADRKNFFELLPKLLFDPPEKNPAKIEKEIGEFEKTFQGFQTETDPIQRKKLEVLKDLLPEMKTVMVPNTPVYNAEAEAMKAIAINDLKANIEIIPNKTVTKGKINTYRKTFRLSDTTIKKVLENNDFKIKADKPQKLPARFDNSMMDRINNDLKEVQNYKDTKGTNLQNVNTLYLFIAYMNEDLSNGANYDSRSTKELKSILEEIITKKDLNRRTDNIGHTFNHLCNAGTSQIFNSDENRKKYDNSLAYESLRDLFNKIKKAGETRKLPDFAENCIEKIGKKFPAEDEALSIYNEESNLRAEGEPYEPEETIITVTCICREEKKFSSVEEAKSAKCPKCGAPFYKPCPGCSELVPALVRDCPFCGFFVAGAKSYDRYYRDAENALNRMDLSEAQKQLDNAINANPKGVNLSSLEQKIKSALAEQKKKEEKASDEVVDLINKIMLVQANTRLLKLRSEQPNRNLSHLENQIKPELDKAKKLFASFLSKSPAEKEKVCLEILNICADYKEAREFLEKTPPLPSPKISVSANAAEASFAVSWEQSSTESVTYILTRKAGSIPVNQNDGLRLVDEKSVFNYLDKDKSIENGKEYGYAVFAKRRQYNSISRATGIKATFYSDINALQVETGEYEVSFKWELPRNAFGVRILRTEGSIPAGTQPKTITETARHNFKDTGLTSGKLYTYRLQALYNGESGVIASKGISCTAHPERYHPCKIEDDPKIDGNDLYIKLKTPLPEKVYKIFYAVRQKEHEDDPDPWVSTKDVEGINDDIYQILVSTYEERNAIKIKDISQSGNYYITLITAYKNAGKLFFAEPEKKQIKKIIPSVIEWGVKKNLLGKTQLILHFQSTQTAIVLPPLCLCYHKTGGLINSAHGDKAVRLFVTQEVNYKPGDKQPLTFICDGDGMLQAVPKDKDLSLFLEDDSLAAAFSFHYIKGFTGKL